MFGVDSIGWCLTTVGSVAELCIASELTSENTHLAPSRRLSTDTAWRANKHLSAVEKWQQLALLHPPPSSSSFRDFLLLCSFKLPLRRWTA